MLRVVCPQTFTWDQLPTATSSKVTYCTVYGKAQGSECVCVSCRTLEFFLLYRQQCFSLWVLIMNWLYLLSVVRMFFARQMLGRQFWTDAQRIQSLDHNLKQKQEAYPLLSERLLMTIDQSKVDPKLAQFSCDTIEQVRQLSQFHRLTNPLPCNSSNIELNIWLHKLCKLYRLLWVSCASLSLHADAQLALKLRKTLSVIAKL